MPPQSCGGEASCSPASAKYNLPAPAGCAPALMTLGRRAEEPLLERLRSLAIAPFRLHLTTGQDFRLPAYKGSVFRGGFGQLFREISCTTHAPSCAGCKDLERCGYSQVFETPILPGASRLLTKYPNAPHPFVLCPPLDERTCLPAGSKLELDVVLLQSAHRWFPHFLFIFDEMGRQGRYGGPYRIERATSRVDGRLLFDGRARQIVEDPPAIAWENAASPVDWVELEFLTPLRMRTNGQYNSAPDFVAIMHALLGRLHLLTAIYGGQSEDRAWMRELLARADHIRTERRDFRLFEWERMSGRQHRRIAMDGVIGRLTASGDLTPFLPALRAGELLHVGSGTSMGLGRYKVEALG